MESGSIVELRLNVDYDSGSVTPTDVLRRPDKKKANAMAVVIDIIESGSVVANEEAAYRKMITDKCFAVRELLYSITEKCSIQAHILVDVGTGRGQALQSMRSNSLYSSYILIEHDPSKTKQLLRGGVATLYTPADDLVVVVKTMHTCVLFTAVFQMTLEDFCSIPGALTLITRQVGLIVCSFSINFTLGTLRRVVLETGIPVVGCCYAYDSVSKEGVLVNERGITMRLLDDNGDQALVK